MRKIIVYINNTFNGVVTGDPGQYKTNFMVWTSEAFMEEGSKCALKIMETVDTLLLGEEPTKTSVDRKNGHLLKNGPM